MSGASIFPTPRRAAAQQEFTPKEHIMPGPGAYLSDREETDEVLEVLRSGHLSRNGSPDDPKFLHKVETLEQEFAAKMGARYCVAVNSGTGALMAALVAAGIGPGSEVLVPGYTFVATYSAVIAVGAVPVLVEIDESLTMDPADARQKITPRTRAVIPVHMLGNPCDMAALTALAEEHHLTVIEDACQALGGSYRGKRLGTLGALGAFSLNNYKVINSGDGGLLITDSEDLYAKAYGFHDQGHRPLRRGVEIGSRTLIGINMRMNELSGAYALAQLRKLDRILVLLREKKARFKQAIASAHLEGLSFRKIHDPEECATLLTVQLEDVSTAQQVARALKSKTVDRSGWHVYNNMEQILAYAGPDGQPLYRQHMLPRTDDILARSINLSVGVVDPGLGADFGINVLSGEDEIDRKAEEFIRLVKPVTG
ncbi:MAG TPA: DegT/DnrJ/EryC1/StrS family aminotransferase [Anaerolineaceae bacterium]